MRILSSREDLSLNRSKIGGKARRLLELSNKGFNVPKFFVVLPEEEGADDLDFALSALSEGPVAVRSSASDEDGELHSFAGQLRTHLNVQGIEPVAAAVLDVAASANDHMVLEYRRQRGLQERSHSPAVVVQQMIAADFSGVLFTADPVSGNHSRARLSYAEGLGAGVVDGTRDCTEVQFDLRTKKMEISGEKPKALSRARLGEIFATALSIAKFYQAPQDIEFCVQGGVLHILQARPITSANMRERRTDQRIVFDNSNIQESFCGMTLPLTFSFASEGYFEVYSQLMRLAGFSVAEVSEHETRHRNMLSYIDGRVFYNIRSWYDGLKVLPSFGRNKQDMERMMGVEHPVAFVADQRLSLGEKLRVLPKMAHTVFFLLKSFARMDRLVREFEDEFEKNYRQFDIENLYRLSAPETLSELRRARRLFLAQWSVPILNDFNVMMANGKVRRALSLKGLEVELPSLMVGEELASTAPTKALLSLADEIKADAGLRLWFRDGHSLEELAWKHPAFAHKIKTYIAQFGDRVVGELKLESLALWQDPAFALDVLRSYASSDFNLAAFEARELKTRAEAEARVFARLKSRRFRRGLKRLRKAVRFRESMRFKRTKVFGLFRRFYCHLGETFARQGVLTQASDIFYLTESEIAAYIEGRSVHRNLKALIALRQSEFAEFAKTEPPNHFSAEIPVYAQSHFEVPSVPVRSEGEGWSGIGCYAGRVQGEVVVLKSPDRDVELKGKILCTIRTDPGWAPLFVGLKGLLVEKGSTLSHSAIVARELGLPTVVGASGVTTDLQTGDLIELDGTSGEIRRLERRREIDENPAFAT